MGLSRERAREVLLARDEFANEPGDVEYAIDRLLARGWFYEVQDDLKVTDPDRDTE